TASRAARIIASPPLACTLSIHTPRRAADLQAPATVFGMSWNLRSRKTSKPAFCSDSTTAGPAATKSSLPTLTRQSAGSRRGAIASAPAASGTSRATMTRFLLSNLHPCEVLAGAFELGGTPRRERLPSTAGGALPVELARLESAVSAQVDRQRLRVGVHEVLHELQVLPPLGRRAHELRVDEPIEAHERGIAADLVALEAPGRIIAFMLGGRLVDDVEEVERGISMLQATQQREALAQSAHGAIALHHALGREPEVGRILR